MASSSVSQESNDFENRGQIRRVKIRNSSARTNSNTRFSRDHEDENEIRKEKRQLAQHIKIKNPQGKRKLREKRRNTGHGQSHITTESTGDSFDDDLDSSKKLGSSLKYSCTTPSDFADFEDNQDYDSAVSHSENKSFDIPSKNENTMSLLSDHNNVSLKHIETLESLLQKERSDKEALKQLLTDRERRIIQLENEVRRLKVKKGDQLW